MLELSKPYVLSRLKSVDSFQSDIMQQIKEFREKRRKAQKRAAANYLLEEGPNLHESLETPATYNDAKEKFEQPPAARFEHISFSY